MLSTQTIATLIWIAVALPPAAVSVAYFFAADRAQGTWTRLAVSAHGLVITVLFLGTEAAGLFGKVSEENRYPFLAICVLPVLLMLYSLVRFRGNRKVHILQIVNVVWLSFVAIVGRMFITGIWL